MSSPGWFPDPAGDPHLQRYWDGTQWTPSTRPAPQNEPQGQSVWPELAPQTTTPWGQQQQPPPKRRTGLVVGLVALVVLLIGGGAVAAFTLVGGDDDPSTKTTAGATTDPTEASPSPTETAVLSSCPSFESTQVKPTDDGRVAAGGLSFPLPEGFRITPRDNFDFLWSYPWAPQYQIAQRHATQDWYSLLSVARLPIEGGYTTMQQTAESLVGCVAHDDKWFEDEKVKALVSEGLEVDGHAAWVAGVQVVAEDSPFQYSRVKVVVVDTGVEGEYGLFIGSVPDDDDYAEFRDQLDWAIDRLRVD